MTPEEIKTKYEPRILALMNQVRELIEAETPYSVSEPFEMPADEWRWDMVITVPGMEDVGYSFTILESEVNDGEENGVSFEVNAVAEGGQMLGGMCPGNYSDDLWVPRGDEEAVEERFKLFEDVDQASILDLLEGNAS